MRSGFARSDLQRREAICSTGEVNPKTPSLAMAICFLTLRIIALTTALESSFIEAVACAISNEINCAVREVTTTLFCP
jgi:hypothetical protein